MHLHFLNIISWKHSSFSIDGSTQPVLINLFFHLDDVSFAKIQFLTIF